MSLATSAVKLRKRAGAAVVDRLFRWSSLVAQKAPLADPARYGITVTRDLPYSDDGLPQHRLDVWRPARPAGARLPVVLYIHGGGFRILSKETHWVMALAFARRGFLVFNIDYRLAPRHPFPAAVQDAALAYEWVARNAAHYGGDLSRFVVAGESAGANLTSIVTLLSCYRRQEPWAARVFDTGLVPRAIVPACGLLQVSDADGRVQRRPLPAYLADRVREIEEAYLPRGTFAEAAAQGGAEGRSLRDLADPVVWVERQEPPDRPLPPAFLPVGTRDPVLDDSRRMAAALAQLGVDAEARIYPGGVHAFHAFVFTELAQRCWRDTFTFLERHGLPE